MHQFIIHHVLTMIYTIMINGQARWLPRIHHVLTMIYTIMINGQARCFPRIHHVLTMIYTIMINGQARWLPRRQKVEGSIPGRICTNLYCAVVSRGYCPVNGLGGQSIGSTFSDEIARSWLWSMQLGVSTKLLQQH